MFGPGGSDGAARGVSMDVGPGAPCTFDSMGPSYVRQVRLGSPCWLLQVAVGTVWVWLPSFGVYEHYLQSTHGT